MARRSAGPVPVLALCGTLCWLASFAPSFLTAVPSTPRGRTAMRGFKEDFDAWKTTLTPEEQQLVKTQAKNEFVKSFRKSEEFTKELPKEKKDAFSKVLKKFFENEAEDYEKEMEASLPSPPKILDNKGADLDLSLKHQIVEVDRVAERRWRMARLRDIEARQNGEKGFTQSSPMIAEYFFQNNDTESHEANKKFLATLGEALASPECKTSEENKKHLLEQVAKGVPAVGERYVFNGPVWLINQLNYLSYWLQNEREQWKADENVEWTEEHDKGLGRIGLYYMSRLVTRFEEARDLVTQDAEELKEIFQTQDASMSKADVMREIWGQLPKWFDKPVAPLDEEMLAELANEPAADGPPHPWGVADTLYKSEAIDPYGDKYLIGLYETPEECEKAFEEWNAVYEKAREDQQAKLQEWNRFENARMDNNPKMRARMQEIFSEVKR